MTSCQGVIRVEEERLSKYLHELSRFGELREGGSFRPLYSASWRDAKAQVKSWMSDLGLEVREDSVGNVLGRLSGAEPRVILTGSHIDTVRQGGMYDGALGILAGVVAVDALRRAYGAPRKSIEVIATCEEESSRFYSRMWGARAITGNIGEGEMSTICDADGISIGEAMQQLGYDPSEVFSARRDDIDAFIELHIEQGRILEAEEISIGIVEAITGITQLEVTLSGQRDHAGTTPMDLRCDSLVAAARMVVGIRDLARDVGRPGVATVGQLDLRNQAVNIVPDWTRFTVDIRHPEPNSKAALADAVRTFCIEAAREEGVSVQIKVLSEIQGVPLNQRLVDVIASAARDQGVNFKRMISGAGHDAQVFAKSFPTSMIFVPSRNGRSHSPEEFTAIEDCATGAGVLAAAIYRLAY